MKACIEITAKNAQDLLLLVLPLEAYMTLSVAFYNYCYEWEAPIYGPDFWVCVTEFVLGKEYN